MRSSDLSERREHGWEGTQGSSQSPLVFVFLDAWTLVTGRQGGMVERMLGHGFRLLDFEFTTLSEADAEEIYRTNHPIREGNSWHVARLVYPMGRSLGLLFGLNDPQSCACVRMQGFKGKANPRLNKSGQLRYDFLAPNRCLSLMHSSDTLGQVRREGAVFFSGARLDRACAAAREATSNSDRLLQELAEASSEWGVERVEEPGLGALFARVRLRLTKELIAPYPASSYWQAPLLAYRALWDSMSRERARGPVIAEAKEYLRVVAREGELLDALIVAIESAPRTPCAPAEYYRPTTQEPLAVLRCLQALNNVEGYSRWDSNGQLPQNILHDRWERLLFRTHLFNFDDMLGVAGNAQ